MLPCNICSPVDESGERRLTDLEGKPLLGLKQRGKTKYSPNGINFERIYVCQDCGSKWRMIGKRGVTPSYRDVPVLEIVS